ncbi:hypothetical protein K435DRAFT_783380 [Dendrothele bispora CBS 962.96]|uniref:Uncharacterized protein n=1 Tax=Dendrothele bispora (strain CBS 962.96) TaxID=1314807 RepID=A0A4S8L9S6_DENBC|nr:hypothetical protein K435DRAFT_783380 [Dendrothele bispora CBS 962.96]
MGVIFASRIPGAGTSIDLDTDGIHLNETAVETLKVPLWLWVHKCPPSSTQSQ